MLLMISCWVCSFVVGKSLWERGGDHRVVILKVRSQLHPLCHLQRRAVDMLVDFRSVGLKKTSQ